MTGQVNWAAYSEEQLRELELWPLAAWSDAPMEPQQARLPAKESRQIEPASRPAARPQPAAREQEPVVAKTTEAPVIPVRRAPSPGLGQADWASLREQVSACKACILCKMRKQAVFGVGVETAPWLFVGEGPGADEDAAGEPFVGQAGKLLDAMLASIQLSRETNVYIANVVKCRPPGNRTPTLEEATACADYLDRQIDLISPKIIVALGKTAATRLTGQEASLASQRGKDFNYRGYPLLVTYHPAYLLRNLPDKARAWEDLLRAKRIFAEQG